jgi:HK97 family phage major capsid protein
MGTFTKQTPMLYRAVEFDRSAINVEERTIPFSLSSETEVERTDVFGWNTWIEVLGHEAREVRLDRFRQFGALHLDHDVTKPVAAVQEARLVDGVIRGIAKFGATELAEDAWKDASSDAPMRRGISAGYRVYQWEDVTPEDRRKAAAENDEELVRTWRAVDWEVFEGTLTTIPADTAVGVARSAPQELHEATFRSASMQRKPAEGSGATQREERNVEPEIVVRDTPTPAPTPTAPPPDLEEVRKDAAEKERKRVQTIGALGNKWKMEELATEAIERGASVQDFSQDLMRKFDPQAIAATQQEKAKVGMDESDLADYRVTNIVRAQIENNWKLAPLEWEVSEAAKEKREYETPSNGRTLPNCVTIPWDVLADSRFDRYRPLQRWSNRGGMGQRDAVGIVSPGSEGAALRGTQLRADLFIDILRPQTVLGSLGMTILPGLVGDVDLPYMSAGAVVGWVGEDTDATLDDTTAFLTRKLAPKTVSVDVPMTRRLILQSTPAVEGLIRNDVFQRISIAIDDVGIEGGGTNEPSGIKGYSGVTTVDITNAPADSFGWTHIVKLEENLAIANGLRDGVSYLTTPQARRYMKETVKIASQDRLIWDSTEFDRPLNGYPAAVSNLVPSDLTEGTHSTTDLSMISFSGCGEGSTFKAIHGRTPRRAGSEFARSQTSTISFDIRDRLRTVTT